MNADNPFGQGKDKSEKSGAKPSRKATDAARKVQQESSGNRSGIGQRKGRPAPKPGVERPGTSGGSSTTPPGLPKNRPGLPRSGGKSGSTTRKGCGLPFGLVALAIISGAVLVNLI